MEIKENSHKPSVVSLQLFGSFAARRGTEPLPNLRLREGERVLAYLTLHSVEPVTAKELAQRFWPFEVQMNPGAQGDYPSVRQALSSLRQALGPDAFRLTRPYRGAVLLDVSGIDIDIFTFDRLAGVQNDTWPTAFAEAVSLYRGPLLSSWNEPWLSGPRKRRQRSYETMLRQLLSHTWQQRLFSQAERWANLLSEAVPDDEDARRYLQQVRVAAAHSLSASAERHPIPALPNKPVDDDREQTKCEAITLEVTREVTPESETLTLDAAGGAVPLRSPFYIAREADDQFDAALAHRDPIVLLKGSRQVGKTSLLARGLYAARQTKARVVVTDFQKVSEREFVSSDALYRALAISLAQQLEVPVLPRDVWDDDFGPNLNFERFLCLHLLPTFDAPLVWAMDEVDRLLSCSFGSETLGLFRSWYNERSLNPDSILARVTQVIAYATEAHLFITDLNQSPFNVGTNIDMRDFTLSEVTQLNVRYHSPLGPEQLAQMQEMLGGQPYLTRRAFDRTVSGVPFARVLTEAGDEDGIFGGHLRRLWLSVSQSPHLLDVLRGLLTRQGILSPNDFYRLRTSGILSGNAFETAVFRCRLYEQYFTRQFGQTAGEKM